MEELLKRFELTKLDDNSVQIQNKHFSFIYIAQNSAVRNKFKGQYRYLGGLQCNFEKDSKEYIELEKELCIIAEKILK